MTPNVQIELRRNAFQELAHRALRMEPLNTLSVEIHRQRNGVEVARLSNHEGWLEVLPFMGGMLWDACFDHPPVTVDTSCKLPRGQRCISRRRRRDGSSRTSSSVRRWSCCGTAGVL